MTIASALTIVCVLTLSYLDFSVRSDWWQHQSRYQSRLQENSAHLARNISAEIHEIEVNHPPGKDRCMSCHAGILDPSMEEASHPLKTHPQDILKNHPVSAFGCTICHDGRGPATDILAHGKDGFPTPMLQGPLVQSNCYRCHQDLDDVDVPQLAKGRKLVIENGCLGCHKIEGRGAPMGPDLARLGYARTTRGPAGSRKKKVLALYDGNPFLGYIHQAISNPAQVMRSSIMPHFDFRDDQLRNMVIYLNSLQSARQENDSTLLTGASSNQRKPRLSLGLEAAPTRKDRGEILSAVFCVACHGTSTRESLPNPNSIRGKIPSLRTMADRLHLDEDTIPIAIAALEKQNDLNGVEGLSSITSFQFENVRQLILAGSIPGAAKPYGKQPPFVMPAWKEQLSHEDIASIVAYCLTQYSYDDEEWNEEEEWEEEDDDDGVDSEEN